MYNVTFCWGASEDPLIEDLIQDIVEDPLKELVEGLIEDLVEGIVEANGEVSSNMTIPVRPPGGQILVEYLVEDLIHVSLTTEDVWQCLILTWWAVSVFENFPWFNGVDITNFLLDLSALRKLSELTDRLEILC